MNTVGNRHWQATDEAIVRHVVRMADELGLSKVTVASTCRELGINRSTFYEHFDDPYDVMEKTEGRLSQGMADRMAKALCESRHAAFEELFAYVAENAWFYGPHLRHGGRLSVLNALGLGDAASPYAENELDYHLAFFRSGVTAMARLWLERGCPESPHEMCAVLVREYGARNLLASQVTLRKVQADSVSCKHA